MEILRTIWTALTTENQIAQIITSIPMTFIEVSLVFLLFTTILNIKYTTKQGMIYISCFSIIALITTYFIPTPYNTFINIMIYPVLVYFILKTNALKAILAEIVVYISFFIILTPLVPIYTSIFNVTSLELSTIPIYKMTYSLFLYMIIFIVYKLLNRFNLHITILDKFDVSSYNTLIINFIIGIIAIALQGYIEFMYIDYLPISLVIMSIIILVIYFCISLYSMHRTNKLEETKQLLEVEMEYNTKLNTLHDNIRGFKHDFNNMVQAIGGYLATNNIEGLNSYYKDLLDDCNINNNLSVLNPELINNPAIYSLLCDKYCKCEKLGIVLNIEVLTDLSTLNIKIYELTRILGILFDNAIEAASKCYNKTVNIIFKKDKTLNKDLFIIQNTYINKDVNIERMFEKGYSSKEESTDKYKNHGLGLWEVRKYLKSHTNLDLYTTKNNNFFTQQFEIYN